MSTRVLSLLSVVGLVSARRSVEETDLVVAPESTASITTTKYSVFDEVNMNNAVDNAKDAKKKDLVTTLIFTAEEKTAFEELDYTTKEQHILDKLASQFPQVSTEKVAVSTIPEFQNSVFGDYSLKVTWKNWDDAISADEAKTTVIWGAATVGNAVAATKTVLVTTFLLDDEQKKELEALDYEQKEQTLLEKLMEKFPDVTGPRGMAIIEIGDFESKHTALSTSYSMKVTWKTWKTRMSSDDAKKTFTWGNLVAGHATPVPEAA